MSCKPKTWLLILMIAIIPILLMFSSTGSAEIGPKIVQGYIRDVSGNPISCPVVVTLETTGQNTVSDSNGFYRVTFAPDAWNIGDKINVTAQLSDSRQIWAVSVCTAGPVNVVDVQDTYAIPEYGLWGFLLALLIIGVVAIWLLTKKKS